ncbi:MAG: hypothetical protein AMXMBFR58_09460 [Phycisphaerae bacterium]
MPAAATTLRITSSGTALAENILTDRRRRIRSRNPADSSTAEPAGTYGVNGTCGYSPVGDVGSVSMWLAPQRPKYKALAATPVDQPTTR